jgi:hypothetical protein
MSARNRRGLCAYCGKEKKLTVDHVPPKLLLERPLPANILTVPSCADCNSGFKLDDEYTQTVLALDVRAHWNYGAQSNIPAILRSLKRNDARGFVEYLNQQTRVTSILAPNGIPMVSIEGDRNRVNASGMHILRGLYFHETGKRLCGTNADVRVASTTGLTPEDPNMLTIARVFSIFPDRRDGALGSAFSYVAAFGYGRSVWLMLLYNYFFWIGNIDERDVSEREKDETEARSLKSMFPVS